MDAYNTYALRNIANDRTNYQMTRHPANSTGVLGGIRYERTLTNVVPNNGIIRHEVRDDGVWYVKFWTQQTAEDEENGVVYENLVQCNENGDYLYYNNDPARSFSNISEFATAHRANARHARGLSTERTRENGWLTCEYKAGRTSDGIAIWMGLNEETDDQDAIRPPRGHSRVVVPAVPQQPDFLAAPNPDFAAAVVQFAAINPDFAAQVRSRQDRIVVSAADMARLAAVNPDLAARLADSAAATRRWQANETEINLEVADDCAVCMEQHTRFIRRTCGHQLCFECNLNTRKAKVTGWYENLDRVTTERAYERPTACPTCRAKN